MSVSWLVLLVLLAMIVFWINGAHTRLGGLRDRFKSAFAQIDALLKQRYALIPLLVDTARGAMKHERETLESVLRARDGAIGAESAAAADPGSGAAIRELIGAEGRLRGALDKLFALAEAYPDLKSDPAMAKLGEELAAMEGKVAFARQAFNDAVVNFNDAVREIPASLIAALFRFRAAEPLRDRAGADERRSAKPRY